LDSGPQQILVAVKVGLGPTRMRAERAGAEKTAALLAQLEVAAGSAIESLREFAAGVYPPLLEAEGLPVAIGHQAARAALPVSVRSDDLPRYDRETEAAVYFSVLESLQNCAKYSGAPEAWVTLSNGDGRLRFEVRDEGRGFDTTAVDHGAGLNGMADRLDTVGGEVRIDSAPGRGTVVSGSVPTA
jgi:signal transduction histidine kinase